MCGPTRGSRRAGPPDVSYYPATPTRPGHPALCLSPLGFEKEGQTLIHRPHDVTDMIPKDPSTWPKKNFSEKKLKFFGFAGKSLTPTQHDAANHSPVIDG